DIQTICTTRVVPDAVEFDSDAIRTEAIRAEDEYAGTRAALPARCGTARLALQVDMGVGDSVWPAPRPCAYPSLLAFPPPNVLAYPREGVVAEKLEAMTFSEIGTVASGTFSISTTLQTTSSSTGRRWSNPCVGF